MNSGAGSIALGDAQFRREAAHALTTPLGSLLLQAELIEHLLRQGEVAKAQAAAGALVNDCETFGHRLRDVFAAMSDMAEDGAVDADPRACLDAALDDLGETGVMIRYQGDAPRLALPSRALEALMRRVVVEATALGASMPRMIGVVAGATLRLSVHEENAPTAVLRDTPFEGPDGLNLWTARAIAARHGGTLFVPEDGTVVLEIVLPISARHLSQPDPVAPRRR